MENKIVQSDPSELLKNQTNARIGLGNVGGLLPTEQVLALKLDHARAKDAVFTPLDSENLMHELTLFNLPLYRAESKAANKIEYLKRPDFGRRLQDSSKEILKKSKLQSDIVIVITDGLSAEGVNTQVIEILNIIIPEWAKKNTLALVLVENGRVAVADEIGELLDAKFSAIFIGERPGLSSPKSMGIYTTFRPKIGLTDESRNCISNIHPEGLNVSQAVQILNYFMEQSFKNAYSGFNLKLELGKIQK